MAVAFVTSTAALGSAASPTLSLTVSGTNTTLYVAVGMDSTTAVVTSMSWSLGGTATAVASVRSGTAYNVIWQVLAPGAGAGTLTVRKDVVATCNHQLCAACYQDVHQTTVSPTADAQTSTTTAASQTLTPTNLTASEGSFGAGVNTVSNNPGGISPNSRYSSGASSVNSQVGDATGTTGITMNYDNPDIGSGSVAKVAVRIVQAAAAGGGTGWGAPFIAGKRNHLVRVA